MQAVRPLSHECRWTTHSLLGRAPLSLLFHGCQFKGPFLLAKVQFPIINVDFLRQFKLLLDPAANCLVDTINTQLLPTVWSMRSQPEPVATAVKAASSAIGQAFLLQVKAQEQAPFSPTGCSQIGPPSRTVTAVA
jgi:hypothetical protein